MKKYRTLRNASCFFNVSVLLLVLQRLVLVEPRQQLHHELGRVVHVHKVSRVRDVVEPGQGEGLHDLLVRVVGDVAGVGAAEEVGVAAERTPVGTLGDLKNESLSIQKCNRKS